MPKRVNTDAGIESYQTLSGKRWSAVCYGRIDPNTGRPKQVRKQGFLTKAEAQAWRSTQLHDRAQGKHALPTSDQTLAVYLTEWLASRHSVAAGTTRNYTNRLKPIIAQLGTVPLDKLTAHQIDTCHAALLRSGHSPSAVRYGHRILKQALRRAFLLGLIPANPADRVTPPREPKPAPVLWTLEDMQRFVRTNQDDPLWGCLWVTMAETWMRVSEVAALRWRDVDWQRRSVTVREAISRNAAMRWVSGPTKTESSQRAILISPLLINLLADRRKHAAKAADDDLIFPPMRSDANGYLAEQVIARALRRACVAADVPVITPHGLRHNGGSVAYMNGIDIKTISERMGHSSITLTLNTYTHLNERHHRSAADAIGALLEGTYDAFMRDQRGDGLKLAE